MKTPPTAEERAVLAWHWGRFDAARDVRVERAPWQPPVLYRLGRLRELEIDGERYRVRARRAHYLCATVADGGDLYVLPPLETARAGTLTGIGYQAAKGRERGDSLYDHHFRAPCPTVEQRAGALNIARGASRYTVEPRGIVG